MLPWYRLVAKTLPKYLQEILSACMTIDNLVWEHSLNNRLFQAFCESVDPKQLLSNGHVLECICELCFELKTFVGEQKFDLSAVFESSKFLQMLAYLTGIFLD